MCTLPSSDVEPPLANLLRTIITVALTKSALRLVPTFVHLQRTNGLSILNTATSGERCGLHTLLHAAAVVLRAEQDERIRSAGILSTMGDGSNDRKTTEQVRGPCPPRRTHQPTSPRTLQPTSPARPTGGDLRSLPTC